MCVRVHFWLFWAAPPADPSQWADALQYRTAAVYAAQEMARAREDEKIALSNALDDAQFW